MLVLVSNSVRATGASYDLHSTAKIKSEVEALCPWHRHVLAEIKKSSRTARERLKHLRPSKVQFQTYLGSCLNNIEHRSDRLIVEHQIKRCRKKISACAEATFSVSSSNNLGGVL